MSLLRITEAMELLEQKDVDISMEDKEFIAQYAFRTGDMELVKKLIEELQEKDANKDNIHEKYMVLADRKAEWAERIENLLISLEMYRIEEERAVRRITDFLTSHGIDISENIVKYSNLEEIKSMVTEAKEVVQKEAEVIKTQKAAAL